MTNLLVQSVDTIHFYHFLSTEHNCVQITPSQGNSHKILLSIKINVLFYFWENKREIGKAVQEKKNLGQTLFFDGVLVAQTVWWWSSSPQPDKSVPLICFPLCHPIPFNPNTSENSSVSDAIHGSRAGCQQQGWQTLRREGRAGVLREWSREAEMAGTAPVWSAWLPLLLDFRAQVAKNQNRARPLGEVAAVGCQLLSPRLDPLCLGKGRH